MRAWSGRLFAEVLNIAKPLAAGRACGTVALTCLFLSACGESRPNPGVRVGERLFERMPYSEDLTIGDIRSITVLPDATSQGATIVVGGVAGAALLRPDGAGNSIVPFSAKVQDAGVLDLEKDGSLEYMNRGGGWSPVRLLDSAGKSVWEYPSAKSDDAPNAMAVGDLDSDGDLEFVVGMNGGGGLRALDEQGIEVWRKEAANVFSVAVLDTNEDGKPEIIHSQGGNPERGVWVRNGDGGVIRQLQPGFLRFGVLRWPTSKSAPALLGVVQPHALHIVNFSGEVLAEFTFPDSGSGEVLGTGIRLGSGEKSYLAVVRTLKATWDRSALYIFDTDSKLVYHEIFPVGYLGLAVLPADDRGIESFLVGGGSSVSRYVLRSLAAHIGP